MGYQSISHRGQSPFRPTRISVLFLQLSLEWMDLEINQINGTILTLNTSVQNDFMENVGLGAGCKYIDIDVDSEKDNLLGGIVYRGPEAYLRLGYCACFAASAPVDHGAI
jgi:hypothetical protein